MGLGLVLGNGPNFRVTANYAITYASLPRYRHGSLEERFLLRKRTKYHPSCFWTSLAFAFFWAWLVTHVRGAGVTTGFLFRDPRGLLYARQSPV